MAKLTLAALMGAATVGALSPAQALPKAELDLPAAKPGETKRVAIFAGGCFWCTEGVFEMLDGVSDVVSGYAGDTKDKANYRVVSEGVTKHAEAIAITYDPTKITFAELLRVHFTTHDPTTKDRQGNDVGPQYRSAIFYQNEEEKKVAESYIAQLNKADTFGKPVVTTVEPIGAGFFEAETYHQNYVKNNPDQPYVCAVALPKIEKVKKAFPDKLKK